VQLEFSERGIHAALLRYRRWMRNEFRAPIAKRFSTLETLARVLAIVGMLSVWDFATGAITIRPVSQVSSPGGTGFSHVVIFWTKPDVPNATDRLIAGAEALLRPIPGLLLFHVGRPVRSDRAVVDQSYQVALNTVFPNREAREAYRRHPLHDRFKNEILPATCARCVVYDFE
jgi:hypothetical protein